MELQRAKALQKTVDKPADGASLYSVSGINRVSHFAADIACVSLGKLVE
jgi:hypothetical protein